VNGSAQTTFSPRAQFAIKPDWKRIWFSEFQRGVPSAAIL
jgi:hypothetical protein